MEEQKRDLVMACECGADFVVTTGERTWYEAKGFEIPRRCPRCRAARRAARRAS